MGAACGMDPQVGTCNRKPTAPVTKEELTCGKSEQQPQSREKGILELRKGSYAEEEQSLD